MNHVACSAFALFLGGVLLGGCGGKALNRDAGGGGHAGGDAGKGQAGGSVAGIPRGGRAGRGGANAGVGGGRANGGTAGRAVVPGEGGSSGEPTIPEGGRSTGGQTGVAEAGEPGAAGSGEAGAASCSPDADGLLAWWRGEGTADDAVGGTPGALYQVTFTEGQVDQSFSFDGTDSVVDLGNAPKLHVSSSDFTVETWVRFNSQQGDMSLVDKMSAANGANLDGWRLLKQADDRFWFCFGGGAQNRCTPTDVEFTVFSTTVVAAQVWFHVAVVKSESRFELYLNGQLEDSRSAVPDFVDSDAGDLLLGSSALEGAHLDGSMDEILLFGRALTSTEIRATYDAGARGECHSGRAGGGDEGAGGGGAGVGAGVGGVAGGSGAVDPFECSGDGLVHVVLDECMADGGDTGFNDLLEVYCCGGKSRFCLSGEACPWRNGCTDDTATCSHGGLSSDYMADAWCSEWAGRSNYFCSTDGQIRFEE